MGSSGELFVPLQSQSRYDSLTDDKRRLEESLKNLEQRVIAMQHDMVTLKERKEQPITINQPSPPQQPPAPPPQPQPSTPTQTIHIPIPTFIPIQQPASPTPAAQPPPSPTPVAPQHNVQNLKDKIKTLKKEKEDLTQKLQMTQSDLRDATRENNILQKQITDLEKILDKLNDKLEQENNNLQKTKEQLDDEKQKGRRAEDQLEGEKRKTEDLKKELGDKTQRYEKEMRELQDKLDHAGKVIATLESSQYTDNQIYQNGTANQEQQLSSSKQKQQKQRKASRQPVEEMINASESGPLYESSPDWNFPDEEEQHAPMDVFLTENEFDYPEPVKGNDQSQDTLKIKELEDEKQDLQKRLSEAKFALDDYTSKLDNQVRE
ncbi:probable basic-leucine zipper transcription factor R [Rhopilema esculentum]|uniref:probable basic-leucine zipper transcription factor R n=1 Tax=Rhopilema esculentum TaxID=499914 RepID=UPI0031D4C920